MTNADKVEFVTRAMDTAREFGAVAPGVRFYSVDDEGNFIDGDDCAEVRLCKGGMFVAVVFDASMLDAHIVRCEVEAACDAIDDKATFAVYAAEAAGRGIELHMPVIGGPCPHGSRAVVRSIDTDKREWTCVRIDAGLIVETQLHNAPFMTDLEVRQRREAESRTS